MIECRKPYTENTSTNKCERSTFDIVTIPVLILLAFSGIGAALLLVSKIITVRGSRKAKTLEEAYAYFTAILFLARIFLLGNLWAAAEVFAFAL